MYWTLPSLSPGSPVEAILDKETFTLEELLDEEEIIQECKALNSRLINFLRDEAQVKQLLKYIVEEPPEDADNNRAFKFPFISCEIFCCEIDVILKTLVEDEKLMDLLFSFLEPDRSQSAMLAGYFSKVVVCLMLRKTVPLMNYVKAHQDVFRKLVDLIGITSIMEVLVRMVGADDHVYPNFLDVIQWLADSDLLEMIVEKLHPSNPPEVHANAAETLCTISRNQPSALATKLSTPSFVVKIFEHVLEESESKSGLVHSLSVCISLLDPKRSALPPLFHSFRNQQFYESRIPVDPDTINAMLPKLGDLLVLLNVSSDERVLLTTYGVLRPPLGKHRLKIVEFIAVLIKTGYEVSENELVSSGTIRRILDLFFEYPYNNSLHHHVESIINSCLESKNVSTVDHLLNDCDLIGKFLHTDKDPILPSDANKPTLPASGKQAPRTGNIGHITRIANKMAHMESSHSYIQSCLKENGAWNEWKDTVLKERNAVENVYRWACGRPTALQDRTRDSDEEDLHDRDYDITALANNLSQAFRYRINEDDDGEEDQAALNRDDEDVYFDDESAEVVISSLRLGDDQGSLFTNSNWFAFDNGFGSAAVSTSQSLAIDEINLNENANDENASDDEVLIEEDEEMNKSKQMTNQESNPHSVVDGERVDSTSMNERNSGLENGDASTSNDDTPFQFSVPGNNLVSEDRPVSDWAGWGESPDPQVDGSSVDPFVTGGDEVSALPAEKPTPTLPNGSADPVVDSRHAGATAPSVFEEDVEFVGVEVEGAEKAMERALKEGIVGEAGALKRSALPKAFESEKPVENDTTNKEFNDTNFWKVDQEVSVLE
uniref:SIT4 phosphatase-associated family protein n=1 Tax=Kalanchoe fedtschenkoi TaxID=63787 RepID=A0A7N0RDC2_KALFE